MAEKRGGVHQKNKYAEIKEALGIPQDEPIFILRGQDKLTPTMLDLYDVIYMATAEASGVTRGDALNFSGEIQDAYDEFRAWQRQNTNRVAVPD